MAKRKRRTKKSDDEQRQLVTEPIDYDKLQECMVKAIETVHEKESEKYSAERELMKFLIFAALIILSVTSGIIAVSLFIWCIKNLHLIFMSTLDIFLCLKFLIKFAGCMFFISVAFLTFAVYKEIEKENSKEVISTMFSNLVALVALIISLIALLKG